VGAASTYKHWVDALVDDIVAYWGEDTRTINCSCGLSVSGLQHVGRLRGEVTMTNTVMHQLRARGFRTRHTIVRYTSDPWKGKSTQLAQFANPDEAKQYTGHRLVDVPDPAGQLPDWTARYWLDFGGVLDSFSRDVQVLSTHEIYTWPAMRAIVRYAIEHRDRLREVVNRYRSRAPYPAGWIPIDIVCENCHRIDTATVTAVDLDAYTGDYRCGSCGHQGTTSLLTGKLSWRVEWAAIWKVLDVGFEPFGKDHATPGGSRDSCKEIAEQVFGFKPPFPYAYEWVGLIEGGVDKGDMGSSDFRGFTPRTWVSVAPGEPLRYLFLKNKPMKRITVGLEYVPTYVGQFEHAERVYYKLDTPKATPEEIADTRRSYELALLEAPTAKPPLRVPYLHAAILAQIVPADKLDAAGIEKLAESNLIPRKLSKAEREYVLSVERHAKTWVDHYAPASYRIRLVDKPPAGLNKAVPPALRVLYKQLLDRLDPKKWTEPAIRDAMKQVTEPLGRDEAMQHEFFRVIYQAFFGVDEGPRISPFFAFTESPLVLDRIRYLAATPR
jgi:lysyl-tRNA synthetase class 1